MVHWTTDATADVQEIWAYIALDNERAADWTIDKFEDVAERLDAFPRMGKMLHKPKGRQFAVPGTPYKLVYRLTKDGIEILRVLHGARDWPPRG